MITKQIHSKVPTVLQNLTKLPPLKPWTPPHIRSGPQYNEVRSMMGKSGHSFPEELWTLGAGYDIFGFYAYSGSTKLPLYDWSRSEIYKRNAFELPKIVSIQEVAASSTKIYKGESALKLQTSISSSIEAGFNIASLFSSTVTTEIDFNALRNSRNSFCIIQMLIPIWKFAFDPYNNKALQLLTLEFKDALEKMDPNELFRTYGTHFLNEIMIGGRLHYSSYTNALEYKADVEYSVAAEASFNLLIGKLGGEAYARLKAALESFDYSSESGIFSVGGDATIIPSIGISDDQKANRAKYESWLNSVRTNNAFMDFGSRNSLKGIWTLASNATRKNQLKNAAASYIANLGEANSIYSDKIVDVVVVSHKVDKKIQVPSGYEKYPYDLNKDARGDFIYVCYKKMSKEEIVSSKIKPIVGLTVIDDKQNPPTGYEPRIDVDLNKGAKGEFIYLCKKYGQPGVHKDGIRDIAIVGGDSREIPPPYGYTQIKVDLNKGSGGEFIFLCYTKED